jgi:hypothetical protein
MAKTVKVLQARMSVSMAPRLRLLVKTGLANVGRRAVHHRHYIAAFLAKVERDVWDISRLTVKIGFCRKAECILAVSQRRNA